MSDSARIDTSDFGRLEADLLAAGAHAKAEMRPIISKGALNAKNDARQRISGHPRFRVYPYSIKYDIEETATTVSADLYYDKGSRQGALGNILEFGTSKNAPIPHIRPAVDAEAPRTEAAIAALVARSKRFNLGAT